LKNPPPIQVQKRRSASLSRNNRPITLLDSSGSDAEDSHYNHKYSSDDDDDDNLFGSMKLSASARKRARARGLHSNLNDEDEDDDDEDDNSCRVRKKSRRSIHSSQSESESESDDFDYGRGGEFILNDLVRKYYTDDKLIVCPQRHQSTKGVCLDPQNCPNGFGSTCFLSPQLYSCIKRSRQILEPQQIRCIIHMMHNHSLLVKHETGTGKTLIGVVSSQGFLDSHIDRKVYVITPTGLESNFRETLVLVYRLTNEQIDRSYVFMTHTAFVKYFSTRQARQELRGNYLIIDESHKWRSPTSNEAIIALKSAVECKKLLLLSATPAFNSPSDICIALAMMHRTRKIYPIKKFELLVEAAIDGDEEAIDLICQMFRGCISIYSNMDDNNNDNNNMFPRVESRVEILPMTPEYYEVYKTLENSSNKGGIKSITTTNTSSSSSTNNDNDTNYKVFYNGLRQAANACNLLGTQSPKIDWIMTYIKHHPREQGLVFSSFIKMGNAQLVERLRENKIKSAFITGSMSQNNRNKIVKQYNNRNIRVLLCSSAAGQGFDLKETEFIVQMEPNWNLSVDRQRKGRGARRKSHIKLPLARQRVKTIDLILDKPNEPRNIQDYLDDNFDFDAAIQLEQDQKMEMPSIDHYLYRLSRMKDQKINRFFKLIEPVSIENKVCVYTCIKHYCI